MWTRCGAIGPLPLFGYLGRCENALDVDSLQQSHIAPRLCVGQSNAVSRENLSKDTHRRKTAVIHCGAGPIENDGLQFAAHRPISRMVLSPNPNESVIPDPPGAVTIRTPLPGENER